MSSDHTGMPSAAVSAVFGELFSEKVTVFEEEILFEADLYLKLDSYDMIT